MVFNGKDALKAMSSRPDYVLLDIGLPDIPGHEVAKEIREKYPGSIVIALSGYGSTDDKKLAEKAGIAVHLTKPASLKDIEAAMARSKAD
jgi:DNA-binding response OmpR family regulator